MVVLKIEGYHSDVDICTLKMVEPNIQRKLLPDYLKKISYLEVRNTKFNDIEEIWEKLGKCFWKYTAAFTKYVGLAG